MLPELEHPIECTQRRSWSCKLSPHADRSSQGAQLLHLLSDSAEVAPHNR